MKKRIDVIANEEAFNNLSSFNDIEEMNKTVRAYKEVICASIKRSDVQARLITLLELLKRYSCKQIGVSYMCKNTIADKMELSYKTVQRLMKKLEELGMIRQVAMKRKKDMLQTANSIIIQPLENVSDKTAPKQPKKCPAIKTTSAYLKQKIDNKRKAVSLSSNVDKSVDNKESNFVAHWVPERFVGLVSCFYKKAETIQEFWKVVRQCNKPDGKGEPAFSDKQELTIAIRAFKEFVMKVKSAKKMNNIFGYFNGIVSNLMDKFYFDMDFMGDSLN